MFISRWIKMIIKISRNPKKFNLDSKRLVRLLINHFNQFYILFIFDLVVFINLNGVLFLSSFFFFLSNKDVAF